MALDPSNPRWSKAIEDARMPPPLPPPGSAGLGAVYESADRMEKRLIKKVDPVYPSDAKEAHVQGSVVFTLHVDKDGRVQGADLVWGEPSLVNAARDAVLQYRYKPFIQNGVADIENGTPIPVLGEAKITFKLPADPPTDPK